VSEPNCSRTSNNVTSSQSHCISSSSELRPLSSKDLHDLICDVKSLITDLEDRDKVSAIIDSLIDYHNDFNYADNENPRMYLDTGVYAIIYDCGFGEDLANVMYLAAINSLQLSELNSSRTSISDA
jgi:hypothetical protein